MWQRNESAICLRSVDSVRCNSQRMLAFRIMTSASVGLDPRAIDTTFTRSQESGYVRSFPSFHHISGLPRWKCAQNWVENDRTNHPP